MALYKVIDDFLPRNMENRLYEFMVEEKHEMWQFIPYQTSASTQGQEGCQFVYRIQNGEIGLRDLSHDGIIKSFINRLEPYILLRVKANCTLRTGEHQQSVFHNDIHGTPCMTGIYYVNTNNGYTLFKDGGKVESKRNRIVIFPSHLKHCGVTTTDRSFRMVININYHLKVQDLGQPG